MVVKKYGNRRLYDTTESRYITLDELAERVRGGETVQVVDAKTSKDLTQQTLAHIILESRGAAKLLPVPLLEQLIRMGEQPLAEFFGMYLSGALEMYLTARRGAAAMMPYNPFAQMPFASANPFARLLGGWGPPAAPPHQPHVVPQPPPEPPARARRAEPPPEPEADDEDDTPSAPPPDDTLDQVAALRRELEELKRAIRGEDA